MDWLLAIGYWLLAIGTIGGIGAIRPLAVGRIIAPSRRGYAPNDWG